MQGFDLATLGEDVADVIRRLAGGRAVVLAHAYGNSVGRVLAVEHGVLVRGLVLAAASATKVAPDVNETPFIAGDPARAEAERLAALEKAFFAPGHDPRPWLQGWYPATLAVQRAAVRASKLDRYWAGGKAPLLEINAAFDPFKPPPLRRELHDLVGDRVTTVLIDDASHALFPEQPEGVAAAVLTWANAPR